MLTPLGVDPQLESVVPTAAYGGVASLHSCGSNWAGVGHSALTLWMHACEVTPEGLAQNCRYVWACL